MQSSGSQPQPQACDWHDYSNFLIHVGEAVGEVGGDEAWQAASTAAWGSYSVLHPDFPRHFTNAWEVCLPPGLYRTSRAVLSAGKVDPLHSDLNGLSKVIQWTQPCKGCWDSSSCHLCTKQPALPACTHLTLLQPSAFPCCWSTTAVAI